MSRAVNHIFWREKVGNLRKDSPDIVYVLSTGSPIPSKGFVRDIYADSRQASEACAALITGGQKAAYISCIAVATGKMSDATIWLHTQPGNGEFRAYPSMGDAEAARAKFGGTVKAYRLADSTSEKSVHGGTLREGGRGSLSQQDYPAELEVAPELQNEIVEAGFFRAFKKAIRNPQDMFRRGLE